LGSSPAPSLLSRKQVLFFSVFLYVSLPTEEEAEGVGEEPNHTTKRKLALYKSINTLWHADVFLSPVKGTVSRDFLLRVCFINHILPSP
jgi:hypothetical protein